MVYILETERLLLRELVDEDSEALAMVLSDKDSMKYYPHEFSHEEVKAWIAWNRRNYREYGFGLWAVIRKEDSSFLGDCGITMQNIDNNYLPEIGFHIISAYRRKGYASEAAIGVMEFVREKHGFIKLYSYCEEANLASLAVMRKIGMKREKAYISSGIRRLVYSKKLV